MKKEGTRGLSGRRARNKTKDTDSDRGSNAASAEESGAESQDENKDKNKSSKRGGGISSWFGGGGKKSAAESSDEEEAPAAEAAADTTATAAAPAPAAAAPTEWQSGLTERVQPKFVDGAKQAATEKDLYCRPLEAGFISVLSRRIAGSALYAQPISELKDGLHVESMPHLRARSLHLLDARLGDELFDPPSKTPRLIDGTILRQPDPVRHVRVRPSHPGMNAEVETARPHATVHLVDATSRNSNAQHTLQVSVGLVQLHDHPLFREENAIQRRLRSLAEEYGELRQKDAVVIQRRRVVELRRRLEPYLTGGEPAGDDAARIRTLCIELLQARREGDEHECAERLLSRRMLHMWQQLRTERRQQGGWMATRAKLQVQLVTEEADLEQDLDDEVEERRLVHTLDAQIGDGGAGAAEFDEGIVRQEVATRQQALRRAGDEQTLVPVYTEDTPPTDLSQVPPAERRRQLEAGQVLLYGVLLVDGRVVGTTDTTELHPFDFCARMNYSLQLLLQQAPASISLQLWQRRLAGLADFLIAEIFLAVPEAASPAAPKWQHYDFASEKTFTVPASRRQEAAASSGDGPLAMVPLRCLCGQAAVSVAWAAQPATRNVAPAPAVGYRQLRSRGATELQSGSLDTTRVGQHVRAEDLDPNAPQDVPLLSLLSRAESGASASAFRAFRFGRELQLMKSWLQSDRLKLLQLRRDRPHEWHALPTRAVPQRDAEIPTRMREILQRGTAAAVDDDAEVDDTRQKSKLRKWVQQVQARQQQKKTSSAFMVTTKDFVKEPLLEQEVEAFDCNAFLEKLFSPRRKLRPRVRPRKPEPGSNEVPRKVEIVVVEGVDLPVRAAGANGEDAGHTNLFVEIAFQGQRFKTDIKPGPTPIWNQRAHLNLTAPNGDWSQQAMMNLNENITFNLFDRKQVSLRDDRDSNLKSVREEKRWLASFSVPFATLYRNGEVKGVFPLSMPPILLGYAKDKRSLSKRLVPASALKLFITIDPLLPPLKAEVRELYTKKDAAMQEYATRWVKGIKKGLPKHAQERDITVFAPTATGEKALVCKFVRPQPPPPNDMMASDERKLLRFVSHIPFVDDAALGASLDVWNTTASFLDLLAGDAEEHALLLCNLFKALGKTAYVLIGTELPDGDTAYVLTLDGGQRVRLWDACEGKVYGRDDPVSPLSSCPLTLIGCVFNGSNVWANLQTTDRPSEMNWDLNDPRAWKPFFGKGGYPAPKTLQSVQTEALDYRRTTEEYRSDLEREVEDRLQREFEDLRGHRPTDWNRSLANTLKKLLKRFEDDASGGPVLTKEEHEAQLDRVSQTFNLVGYPIHAAMIDGSPQPLIEKLRATNIHEAESKGVQFALTALVVPFVNNVCSVWVYVAALHDMRAVAA